MSPAASLTHSSRNSTCSLQSQLSESARVGVSGVRGVTLPRPQQAFIRARDIPPHLGLSMSSLSSSTSERERERHLDRERDRDGLFAPRRGSFVERCQERAKISDIAGTEARLGLRPHLTSSASRRPAPSVPSYASSSSLSPIRSQTPTSPRRGPALPIGEATPPDAGPKPESPSSPPPTSPKPHMNETSF
ncbi:hypothetical protein PGIGA_G00227190 [Pangasianodon gigas]|uniref:Uncharacterized protein n=1 Tax=Pangasianodon gigas TaxID=30993 RepID=A0ACC5WKY3_PANGG|nr:hypothetical protein [Pangasianodon gigas]